MQACEYYQTDMIPEIKKQTEKLRNEMMKLESENSRLLGENNGLKGSLGDSMKYHQSKNEELQKVIADQTLTAERHKKENDELRSKINQIHGCLNIKT